jgi:hypothetical protein
VVLYCKKQRWKIVKGTAVVGTEAVKLVAENKTIL